MKHIINGCGVNLRTLTDQELDALMDSTADRLARCQEELDSLGGEKVRRSSNVYPLRREYEGPAVQAPPYLMDPA